MTLIDLEDKFGLTFRKSTESDKAQLNNLIESRFGNRDRYNVCDSLENRYLIALNDNKEIVAMTGLNPSGLYNGLEVDWTCVSQNYTGHGIIAKMLGYLLQDCEQDVYCSCWRQEGKQINLYHAMQELGFKPVLVPRVTLTTEYYDCGERCKKYNPITGACRCFEDLYVRKAK